MVVVVIVWLFGVGDEDREEQKMEKIVGDKVVKIVHKYLSLMNAPERRG